MSDSVDERQAARRRSTAVFGAAIATVIASTGLALYLMGRPLICTCGEVHLWHGTIDSGTSQHIFDWYSLSHVIHGFIFFGILRLVAPKLSLAPALLIAVLPEAAWELLENTDAVIERYRESTVSLDYYGDSVINSVFDILSMVGGFALAAFAPVWATLLAAVALELAALIAIRDNLALNVLMLVYPLDPVRDWQSEATAAVLLFPAAAWRASSAKIRRWL